MTAKKRKGGMDKPSLPKLLQKKREFGHLGGAALLVMAQDRNES